MRDFRANSRRSETRHGSTSEALNRHCAVRCGSISPKAIVGIVVFLAVAGFVRWATLPGAEITVLESQRVNGKTLAGLPINIDAIRRELTTGGLGLGAGSSVAAHMQNPLALKKDSSAGRGEFEDEPRVEGTEGAENRAIDVQPDPNGNFLMVRLRLSREFLERQGKVKNLTAVISNTDIQLTRAGGASMDAIFLSTGVRDETPTGAQFNFGGGNTLLVPAPAPAALWLATGQIKQAQELSGYVEFTCLFGKPPGAGDLSLNIVGTTVAIGQ